MNKKLAKYILEYDFIIILLVFIMSHYFNTWTVSYLYINFYMSEMLNAIIGLFVQIMTIIIFPYIYLKFIRSLAEKKINEN